MENQVELENNNQPQPPTYTKGLFLNLQQAFGKENLPDEATFTKKITTDKVYRDGVHKNLIAAYGQDNVPDLSTFDSKVLGGEVKKKEQPAVIEKPSEIFAKSFQSDATKKATPTTSELGVGEEPLQKIPSYKDKFYDERRFVSESTKAPKIITETKQDIVKAADKRKNDALDNTVKKWAKQNNVDPNSPKAKQQRKVYEEGLTDGGIFSAPSFSIGASKDGAIIYRNTGMLDSFANAYDKVKQEVEDAKAVKKMTDDEAIQFLKEKKSKPEEAVPERAYGLAGGFGDFFGGVSRMIAKQETGALAAQSAALLLAPETGGTSLLILGGLGGSEAIRSDMQNQAYLAELEKRYQQGLNEGKDEKEAIRIAKIQAERAGNISAAEAYAFGFAGQGVKKIFSKPVLGTGVKESLGKVIMSSAKEILPEVVGAGATVTASSLAKDISAKQLGYNVTTKEMFDNAWDTASETWKFMGSMMLLHGAVNKIKQLPGYAVSQLKSYINSADKGVPQTILDNLAKNNVLDPTEVEKTKKALEEHAEAKNQVASLAITDEIAEGSISGKQEKKNKLQKEIEELKKNNVTAGIEDKQAQIDKLNKEIEEIYKTGNINEHEFDNQLPTIEPTEVTNNENRQNAIAFTVNDVSSIIENNKTLPFIDENGKVEERKIDDFDIETDVERLKKKIANGTYEKKDLLGTTIGKSLDSASVETLHNEIAKDPTILDDILSNIKNRLSKEKPTEVTTTPVTTTEVKTTAEAIQPEGIAKVVGEKVEVKNAPKGNHLNIGLLEGRTNERMSSENVLSKLPKDVKVISFSEVEGTEPTLSVETSRPLTDAEMTKLLEDTKQQAIPQLTEGKGVLYDVKRGTPESWGEFNPEYFVTQKGENLKQYASKAEVKAEPKTVADTVADDLFTHLGIEPEVTEATAPKVYTSENVSELTSEGLEGDKKAAVDSVKNVVSAIDKLVEATTGNKLKVSIYDNQASFTKGVEEYGGSKQDSISKGFYMSEDGTIHLNLDRVSSETMLHEGFHPVLDYLATNKPEIIDNFHKQLSKLKGGDKIIADAEKAYKGMGDTTIKKEAITDFIAKIADPNNPLQLDKTNFEKVKAFVLDMFEKMGLKFDKDIRTIDDLQKLAQVISKKFNTGEEIKTEIQYKQKAQNSNSSEGINNDFNTDNIKGKSDRGIQLSKETSRLDDETIKAVKTSIINYKSIPNLKISRTLFYDNTRVGKLEIKNRITGYTPDVTGKGGFFFSYMPEALKNKAVLAFTSINQAIQTLKRQRLYPDAAQAIAAQNFQTAHLGNKSTLKALFGEPGSKELGVFQESVKNNPKGEIELLNALKDSTISIANQTVKSGVNAGKPTASALEIKKIIDRNGGSLDNIKSIDEFRDKVLTFKGGDSFGARNILFTEILQGKPTKVTKSTRDAHQIMHYKYGIPTLSEIAEGNNQKQLNNAETGDVIKLVKPYSEPIVYTTDKNIYKQYSENPTPEMIDNGIKIELLPEGLNHESYPFVLKGENVGILDNYISAPQLYEANEKIKNVPKKQSFYNVGRMPAEAAPGEYPREPISQGVPQWSRGEDLIESTGKRKEMTEDDKGNYLFFHYSDKKFNKLSPEKVGTHLATGRDERTGIPTSSLYTRPDRLEPNVPSDFGYITRVPKEKVYSFNADPLNLMAEAEARFKKENKDRAFDANNQFAYVAKVAAEKGFPVTVAEWNMKGTKALIAKTTEALPLEKYTNIKAGTTNQIEFAKGTEDIKPNAKRRDIKFQKESQDAKIKDFIEMQREKGISDEDIKAGLEKAADRIGLDKNKIDELLTTKKEEYAVQEPSPEGVLQPTQEGAGEAGGKRTGMEQAEQGAIPPKEGKPSEAEVGGAEEKVGITKKDLKQLEEDYEVDLSKRREKITDVEMQDMAKNLIDSGYDVAKLVKKSLEEEKYVPTDLELNILAEHAADMKAKIDANSSNADIAKYRDILSAINRGTSEAGRALRMAQVKKDVVDSIADVMTDMMDDYKVDELTKEQRVEAEERFKVIEDSLNKYKESLDKVNAELEKLKAEKALQDLAEKNKKDTPAKRAKTNDDYTNERKVIIASIKEKWNKASKGGAITAVPLPFSQQLAAIAPDVAKLIGSYLEQGAAKTLDEVRSLLKKDIEDIGIKVTDEEVSRLIAGEGVTKKESKNELARQRYEIKEEQKLLLELENLEQFGEPKTRKEKIQKNQKLAELRKKIKDLTGEDLDDKFIKTANQRIKANETKLNKIQDKIDAGDFAKEPKPQSVLDSELLQEKNKELYNAYLKSVVDKDEAMLNYERARVNDKIKNESKLNKIGRYADIALNTSKGTVAMFDQSYFLVQMLPFTFSHPSRAVKFAKEALLKDFISADRFKRTMAILHESPLYDLIEKTGLAVFEPRSFKSELRTELHGGEKNLWNKEFEFKGKKYSVGQAFERSTTSFMNNARISLFMDRVEELYEAGKTFENSPEEFKSAARAINELTGQGKVQEHIQMASPIVNKIIWSPKMFASTLNVLGLGDVIRPVETAKTIGRGLGFKIKETEATKGFYSSLTPEQRKFALKEVGRFVGMGATLMVIAQLSGADDVDVDPRSSGFGTITFGNKTYNVFGRFASAARTIVQVSGGVRMLGGKKDVLGDKFGDKTAGDVLYSSFGRGKMTPAAGLTSDLILNNRKNYFTKEEIDLANAAKSLAIPLAAQDMQKDFKRDNVLTAAGITIAKLYGANISDKRDFEAKMKSKKKSTKKGQERK